MWRWNRQTVQVADQLKFLFLNVLICRRRPLKLRFHSHSAVKCEVLEWLKRDWFVPFNALVSCFQLWIIYIPVECVKLRNLCICPNEKKTIFFAFCMLECFNTNLHGLTFDQARRGIGVRQRNIIFSHFSNLREKSPQVNHNRCIKKLIGVFGWCQTTLFFTYGPPHALHAAQITSEWKCRIFFRLWFDQWHHIRAALFASNAALVGRNNHNTRITSRSLRPTTHTMLTPLGIFVYFEVNYARVTLRQRSSFQISDWLVWQIRVAFQFSFTWKWMYWNQL